MCPEARCTKSTEQFVPFAIATQWTGRPDHTCNHFASGVTPVSLHTEASCLWNPRKHAIVAQRCGAADALCCANLTIATFHGLVWHGVGAKEIAQNLQDWIQGSGVAGIHSEGE